ncbi:MAG: hypothetical protein V9G29_04530 [Burkholderiaceae bacterium]
MRFLLFILAFQSFSAADLVTEGWHHRVWAVYPVEKVKADEELPDTPIAPAVTMSAARGEREPFVAVLRPQVPLREVSVVTGVLQHANGGVIPAANITAQRLGYVFIDEPSGTRIKQTMPYPVGMGQFPDPLLANRGEVRPGHNLQFLITVQVPRDARPGRYEGTVKLAFRKETWMKPDLAPEDTIRVVLNVRRFALPERSPLLNTSYANLRELPEAQRTPERLAEMQRGFIEHRQTPEPLMPSPKLKIGKDGVLTVDSAAWEQAVEAVFQNGGTHVFVPVWGFYPEPGLGARDVLPCITSRR